MINTRIPNRYFSLIFEMRKVLYPVILAGIYMMGGCAPTSKLDFKPQPVIDIVSIQPFRLEKSFKYDWRSERPDVSSGLLIVIKVDPRLVAPTNGLQPVLYAGSHTVQRINQGNESGFVIGIIPGQIDLSKEPIWFGTPALPERIDAKTISIELANAKRSGIASLKSADMQSRTRNLIVAPDLTTLLRQYAAAFILEFSPQETHLTDAWRLPETRQ